MLKEVVAATTALDGLATALSASWTDQLFGPAGGNWSFPPVNRADLVRSARDVSAEIKEFSDDELDQTARKFLLTIPERVSFFQNSTLPQISGNAALVVDAFYHMIFAVRQSLPSTYGPNWAKYEKSELVPRAYASRIRNLKASISKLEPQVGNLDTKIEAINKAHAAAEELPTDLDLLREAREEISTYMSGAKKDAETASALTNNIEGILEKIKRYETDSERTLSNIEQAYSAATTKGLAASFTERAKSLATSTWIWVALLGISLLAGGFLGHERLNALQAAAEKNPTNTSWIWLNAVMSMIAIAGPVWFAWISTRQISQRFRLAEDYGFKASVARAYEGYRKEAARLDPEFEARLFGSALDRLDEAPLRFLATEEHSSPYEAILASPGFQRALDKVPNLKDTVVALAEKLSGATATVVDAAAAVAATAPQRK